MVNNQGKTDSPTGVEADLWAQELDKNKELNEKMEELCPIVITTIDCRPTAFKSTASPTTSTNRSRASSTDARDTATRRWMEPWTTTSRSSSASAASSPRPGGAPHAAAPAGVTMEI